MTEILCSGCAARYTSRPSGLCAKCEDEINPVDGDHTKRRIERDRKRRQRAAELGANEIEMLEADERTRKAWTERYKPTVMDRFGSWAAFARECGVLASTLSNYANGDHLPTGMNLARMSIALGVSSDWLLGLKDGEE